MKKKDADGLEIGNEFPDLGGIKWIKGRKAGLGKQLTAFFVWESGKDENSEAAEIFNDISESRKGKVSVFALTLDDEETAEIFIEEQEGLFKYSAGILSEELKGSLSGIMKETPCAFLLNSKGVLLWCGSVFLIQSFLNLLDEGKSEEELMETGKLTGKLDALSDEIGCRLTENLKRKSEIIELAENVLEIFPDDPVASDLIRRFDYLIPGETVPALEPIQWIKNKTELGKGLTLVDFWDVGNSHMQSFPEISRIKKKYKDKLTVIGLSEDEPDTTHDFLSEQKEYMNYGVGLISGELFSTFIPMLGSTEDPLTFLINAKGKLLWCGKPWEADMAVSCILEKGNPEDSLIKYAEHLQDFQDFAVNNTGEDSPALDSKKFKELHKLAKKALTFYPGNNYILDVLLKEAGKIGYDEILSVCSEIDTSEFNSEQLRLLFLSFDFLETAKPHEYSIKWMNQAVKLDSKSDHLWEFYCDALAKLYLTDEALKAAEEGLKVATEFRQDGLESRRDHMLRILAGKKAAAEFFN